MPPPGWWRLSLEDLVRRPDEELARQLSLPYAAGVVAPEAGGTGVVALDPVRALPGFRLYVSGHAPEALLLDRDGRVRHRWRCPFRRAFPGREETSETAFFRRARLEADGSLLVLFQGGGLVRLDPSSRPVWTLAAAAFNDFWTSPGGEEILYLEKRPRKLDGRTLLEDFVVSLDGKGEQRWRFSIAAALERSRWRPVLEPPGPTEDRFHSNRIHRFAAEETAGSPFAPGDLLVSLREIDTVLVVSGRTHEVLWARRGPFRRQHEPHLRPGGKILLFDNLGAGLNRSRIVEVEIEDGGAVQPLWPPEGTRIFSAQAGAVHPLPAEHLLVVESERGRAYELDRDLEIVWEFRSPHRAGPRREYVATLFDVVYVAPEHPGLAALEKVQER